MINKTPTARQTLQNDEVPTSAAPGDVLRIESVSKAFDEGRGTREVLINASAVIEPGEFVTITGKSGTGKSTLLNLIAGIDSVDSGNIWFGDLNLTRATQRERTLFRRKHIGFIFQFFNLIPTLTVWENILLPLELNNLKSSLDLRRGEQLLDEVGLLNRKSSFPDVLSGGEQQRVALARALVHQPNLILADEPTGNLDEATGSIIMTLFKRLIDEHHLTVIMVTHSLEAAEQSDRILELHGGQFIEQQ